MLIGWWGGRAVSQYERECEDCQPGVRVSVQESKCSYSNAPKPSRSAVKRFTPFHTRNLQACHRMSQPAEGMAAAAPAWRLQRSAGCGYVHASSSPIAFEQARPRFVCLISQDLGQSSFQAHANCQHLANHQTLRGQVSSIYTSFPSLHHTLSFSAPCCTADLLARSQARQCAIVASAIVFAAAIV